MMAGTPKFKVYDSTGEYQAACKEPEACAVLMTLYGPGATVRVGHTRGGVVWTEGEGADGDSSESYDITAQTILDRAEEIWRKAHAVVR